MEPRAASVFTALTDTDPSQLVWPAADLTHREPACTGALTSQGIGMALGVDSLDYEIFDSATIDPIYFDGYVSQRAGLFTCSVQAEGILSTSITVGHDLAGIVDTMIRVPDSQVESRTDAVAVAEAIITQAR